MAVCYRQLPRKAVDNVAPLFLLSSYKYSPFQPSIPKPAHHLCHYHQRQLYQSSRKIYTMSGEITHETIKGM
jgi:hypothetical protein